MKHLLTLLLSTCALLSAYSQKSITISGHIEEANSKERIANVFIRDSAENIGIWTNENGEFSLQVETNKKHLHHTKLTFSHKGYEEVTIDTLALKPVVLKIILQKMKVDTSDTSTFHRYSNSNKLLLNANDIKNTPTHYLEPDLNKTLQYQAGVLCGTSGKITDAGLHVRGGSNSDNLYLMDGAPIYMAQYGYGSTHSGQVSAFNMDPLKSITFEKQGFSAQYSGRGSSVIDMQTKDGSLDSTHGELAIGIQSARLTLEGPIIRNKLSYVVSGRRSYVMDGLNSLLQPLARLADASMSFKNYFYDFNGKVNYIIDDKNKVSLGYYTGGNKIGFNFEFTDSTVTKFKFDLPQRNYAAVLKWNHIFSDKLTSSNSLIYSRYSSSAQIMMEMSGLNFSLNDIGAINDYILKSDYNYALSNKHQLMFGANYTLHNIYQKFDLKVQNPPNANIAFSGFGNYNLHEAHLYVQDEFNVNHKLKIVAGLNLSAAITGDQRSYLQLPPNVNIDTTFKYNKLYFLPEPRANVYYQLDKKTILKMSSALMQQYVAVSNSIIYSANKNTKPQKTWVSTIGVDKSFNAGKSPITGSVDLFFKSIDNVMGNRGSSASNEVSTMAYGAEFSLQKNYGKLQGNMSYTLAWNTNKDLSRSDKRFYNDFDRRHTVALSMNYTPHKKFSLYANAIFSTGNPYSSFNYQMATLNPKGSYDFALQSDKINNNRYPSVIGVDAGFIVRKQKNNLERTWTFGVNNYRFNPLQVIAFISFTPTISYKLTF